MLPPPWYDHHCCQRQYPCCLCCVHTGLQRNTGVLFVQARVHAMGHRMRPAQHDTQQERFRHQRTDWWYCGSISITSCMCTNRVHPVSATPEGSGQHTIIRYGTIVARHWVSISILVWVDISLLGLHYKCINWLSRCTRYMYACLLVHIQCSNITLPGRDHCTIAEEDCTWMEMIEI